MSDTPKPTVGRIVHVPMPPSANNGAAVAPAVVTRVWNDTTVNVRILADAPASPQEWRTSLTYAEDLEDTAPEQPATLHRWTWPPR